MKWSEEQEDPQRSPWQSLQASLSMLMVKVHDGTFGRRFKKVCWEDFQVENLFGLKRAWKHVE